MCLTVAVVYVTVTGSPGIAVMRWTNLKCKLMKGKGKREKGKERGKEKVKGN